MYLRILGSITLLIVLSGSTCGMEKEQNDNQKNDGTQSTDSTGTGGKTGQGSGRASGNTGTGSGKTGTGIGENNEENNNEEETREDFQPTDPYADLNEEDELPLNNQPNLNEEDELPLNNQPNLNEENELPLNNQPNLNEEDELPLNNQPNENEGEELNAPNLDDSEPVPAQENPVNNQPNIEPLNPQPAPINPGNAVDNNGAVPAVNVPVGGGANPANVQPNVPAAVINQVTKVQFIQCKSIVPQFFASAKEFLKTNQNLEEEINAPIKIYIGFGMNTPLAGFETSDVQAAGRDSTILVFLTDFSQDVLEDKKTIKSNQKNVLVPVIKYQKDQASKKLNFYFGDDTDTQNFINALRRAKEWKPKKKN